MSSVHNSVETVNAAASAIVTAGTRVQPSTVQKRRWGSCWSLYWCFGSYKNNKRIGHAVLVPESTAPGAAPPVANSINHSASIVIPFIAPPSSPASFLQSDPPSATQSPAAGLLSLTSLSVNSYSPGGTASIFTIGPYAHETQLVSPPVFSAFTTEPSTACFTPPPESVQFTTPSSPEVPFAQLLTSSLAHNKRNTGHNLKFPLSQYEFQPYQCPGSPGSHLISPASAVSYSGTSSPFLDKRPPIIEFRMGDAPPKFLGYEHFTHNKWGSRIGSGSLTPNGWGSRLGSGTVTPNGGISRLGSGTLTPNGGISRLGSGTLTPNTVGDHLLENQISEVASLANSDNLPENEEQLMDHRVSFELTGEHHVVFDNKEEYAATTTTTVHDNFLEPISSPSETQLSANKCQRMSQKSENSCCCCTGQQQSAANEEEKVLEVEKKQCRHSISLGSSKDFNFDSSTKEQITEEKTAVNCEWWTNEKVSTTKEQLGSSQNKWTFFPMLQPGIS